MDERVSDWRVVRERILIDREQCSRLKPSYKFHFEGFSNSSPLGEGLVQIQDVNSRILNETQNSYQTHACIIWYMFLVLCEKIKNQPSNSTSCSDNALRFVGSCGGHIILRILNGVFVFNLGLCFKGLFLRECILKGQIAFEGH